VCANHRWTDELQRIAGSYGLDLNREDLASFRGLMDGVLIPIGDVIGDDTRAAGAVGVGE
jgi:hypothetical protein